MGGPGSGRKPGGGKGRAKSSSVSPELAKMIEEHNAKIKVKADAEMEAFHKDLAMLKERYPYLYNKPSRIPRGGKW